MHPNILPGLAAALFLAVTTFGYRQNQAPHDLARYYLHQPDEDFYTRRGVQTFVPETSVDADLDVETVLKQSLEWERRGESLQAIALLENRLAQQIRPEWQLRLGALYLRADKLVTALPLLQEAYNQQQNEVRADAAWFLALLHLRQGNIDKAKVLLKQVLLERGNYLRQAQTLLADLPR